MRLDRALDAAADRFPDKTAVAICGGASITFSELGRKSDALAAQLVEEHGIDVGDRVGIVSGHDITAVVLFWAVLKVGGIVVWLNHDAAAADQRHVLDNAGFALIVVQSLQLHDKLNALDASLPPIAEMVDLEPGRVADWQPRAFEDTAAAAIVYTSGSSGRPKGVCLSHRNLATVAASVVKHMPISKDDSYLMVVPLHYIHGIMQLLVHALAAATVYCQASFVFPRQVVKELARTGVTGFSGVPFHFNALVSRGGFLDADLPDLRWLTVTGGKLPAKAINQILDQFPGVEFHIAYGQTECAPRATALHPSKIRTKPDSVGAPIPDVEVLLLDDDGAATQDGPGEVVIAGDNVMLGYWRDDDATAEVIDEQGRLHTGDIGRFDADGDLYLVGRKSAMIKSAGERIIPEELERVLEAHAGVSESVVVGAPDALYGQRVVAHLLPPAAIADEGAFIDEVREHCLTRIPLARAPREYHVWTEFPRKVNGKPDRVAIAQAGPQQEQTNDGE